MGKFFSRPRAHFFLQSPPLILKLKEGWEVERKRSMRLMTNNPSELNFDILFPSTTPPTTHPPPQKNAYTAGYGVTSFSCVPGWLGNKQTNKQTNKKAAHSTSFLKNKNKNCFYHYTGECIHADSKLRCLGFCHKELQRHHALNWNNKKDWVVLTG